MAAKNFVDALKGVSELKITVKGRRTGKAHSTIVWFVHDEGKVYLLPVRGSDTDWYRNVLKDPDVTLTVGGKAVQAKAKSATKPDHVRRVVEMFAAKYGGMNEIKRWYSKLDVAVEVPIV